MTDTQWMKIVLLVGLIAWMLVASALAVRKDRSTMKCSGRPPWTELDIIGLREGFRENLSLAEIASELMRTDDDVANKAQELGIQLRIP